jgi:hypothetical protein
MGLEDGDRLARLHQQRLVVAQALERGEDRIEALPVARGTADAAVDHQLGGVLGHLGIEVVLDHPERGFGEPAAAGDLRAAGRADHAAYLSVCHGVIMPP